MTLFGIAALIAPIVGPTLGGWLCVNYDWRWIFLINVPVGLVALVAAYAVVDDPDYLKQERAQLRRQPLNFDYIGLGLLVLVMSCWEVALSKGQEWDWLGDPFGRVQVEFPAIGGQPESGVNSEHEERHRWLASARSTRRSSSSRR